MVNSTTCGLKERGVASQKVQDGEAVLRVNLVRRLGQKNMLGYIECSPARPQMHRYQEAMTAAWVQQHHQGAWSVTWTQFHGNHQKARAAAWVQQYLQGAWSCYCFIVYVYVYCSL